jgi:penicillin amidase
VADASGIPNAGGSARARFTALIVAAALGLAGLTLWRESRRERRSAYPSAEGALTAAGLGAPLALVRDRRGVPHVRAASERDAWFGLGYAHAQDRLAQLAWQRRLALGTSAELIGGAGVANDALARTLDFAGLAARDLASARPASRAALEAYAAGVNAWIAHLRDEVAAPPLGLAEPLEALAAWAPAHSLAIAKQHAFALADPVAEILVLEQVVRSLGAGPARGLFPSGLGASARAPARAARVDARAVRRLGAARRALGLAGEAVGSAGFIVAGESARRGRALLSADLHFAPTVPSRMYEAHLRGGELEVAGATLPGVPGIWAGFNPDVAWALVHTPVVVVDLFEETLYAKNPNRFFDAGKWRELKRREESIQVRGGEARVLEVRATARGPLVDTLFPEVGRPLALRFSGQLGGGIDALLGLAHARDVAGAREALRAHVEPVVAALLVDARGAGLVQLAGAIPRRAFPSGLQPVPASNAAYDWSARLTLDELPVDSLAAGTPWLIAADAPLAGGATRIEYLWRPGARDAQLRTRLATLTSAGRPGLAQLVALQSDVGSQLAQRTVASILALTREGPTLGSRERGLLDLLRSWDAASDEASRAAATFHVLSARTLPALLEPALGAELARAYLALPRVPASALLSDALASAAAGGDPNAPWTSPELARSVLLRALRETSLVLGAELGANPAQWTWGRLHRVRFAPLSPRAFAEDDPALGPFASAGASDSIAVSEFALAQGNFDARVIASYRLLVDAGNLDQALTAFAPGQSEHAGHPHALDALERWRQGKPSLLSTSDPVIEDGAVQVLQLEPAR